MSQTDEGFRSTRWILKIPKPNSLGNEEAIVALRDNVENIMRRHGSSKSRVYPLPHQEYGLPLELLGTPFIYFFYSHNGNGNGVKKRRVEVIASELQMENGSCEVLPIEPFHLTNHKAPNNFDFEQPSHNQGREFDKLETEDFDFENNPADSETAPTLDKDRFSDLSDKYQKLEGDNKALQENNNDLAVENASLKLEVASLKSQVDSLNEKINTVEVNFENERKLWKEEMEQLREGYRALCADFKKQPNIAGSRDCDLATMFKTEDKSLQMEVEELSSPNGNETSFGIESQPKETFEEFKDSHSEILQNRGQKIDTKKKPVKKADMFYYSCISGRPLLEKATKKGMDLFHASLKEEKDIYERWNPHLNQQNFWRGARLPQFTSDFLAQTCFSYRIKIKDLYKLLCYLLVESENLQALQIYKKVMEQLEVKEFRDQIYQQLRELKTNQKQK